VLSVSLEKQSGKSSPRSEQTSRPRILISDDQHDILTALSLLLKLNNYTTATVDSPQEALEAVRRTAFDLIMIDLNYSRDTTSGQEGLQLLSQLRQMGVLAPIVVMTAWGNVELAVEAMRRGANDFVQKPWDNQALLSTIARQLQRAETERKQQVQARSELEIARHVQQKLLPQEAISLPHLESAAACLPAREVGGDYYDFFPLGSGRIAGLLADISGKGVAAAMLMANLQACFHSQLDGGEKTGTALLQTVNRLFYASSPAEQYATLFYFEYDDMSRRLQYINCGHPPPALFRADGSVERLPATGTVIGLFPNCPCECREMVLSLGDVIVAFTDGVTEMCNFEGEEFGDEKLITLGGSVRQLRPHAAIRHITEEIKIWSHAESQSDDQTLVILKVYPPQ
jgi:phosphoserine phosphatase RsbU/P